MDHNHELNNACGARTFPQDFDQAADSSVRAATMSDGSLRAQDSPGYVTDSFMMQRRDIFEKTEDDSEQVKAETNIEGCEQYPVSSERTNLELQPPTLSSLIPLSESFHL